MAKKTSSGRNKNRGVRSRKGNKPKHVSRKMSGKGMGRSNSTRRKIQRGGVTVLGDIGLSALALFLAGGTAFIFDRYIETYNGEKV
jgi:hypothetical protein